MENKLSYVLKENVLTDDILHIANVGYSFKGGYIACIEYYTFLNEWNDRKHIKYFKSLSSLRNTLLNIILMLMLKYTNTTKTNN